MYCESKNLNTWKLGNQLKDHLAQIKVSARSFFLSKPCLFPYCSAEKGLSGDSCYLQWELKTLNNCLLGNQLNNITNWSKPGLIFQNLAFFRAAALRKVWVVAVSSDYLNREPSFILYQLFPSHKSSLSLLLSFSHLIRRQLLAPQTHRSRENRKVGNRPLLFCRRLVLVFHKIFFLLSPYTPF